MIEKIEKLRVLHNIRKMQLCNCCGISAKMYGYYLKNGSIPLQHAESMIEYLGYELRIIPKL